METIVAHSSGYQLSLLSDNSPCRKLLVALASQSKWPKSAGFTYLHTSNMNKKSANNIYCCVYGCHAKKGRERHLSFHKFPQPNANFVYIINEFGAQEKVDRRKAWEMKLLTSKSTTFMKVCSLHFIKNDFILPGFDRKLPRLKSNAVPSQNLPSAGILDIPKHRLSHRSCINPMSSRKLPKLDTFEFVDPSSSIVIENFNDSQLIEFTEDENPPVDPLLNIVESSWIDDVATQMKNGKSST
ncbi:hypothetical protein FQA39_LY09786 [Lamprigera yunnana]|nr:hypothetical protein FQA39_LY09786 [Lamprigera yunnana]